MVDLATRAGVGVIPISGNLSGLAVSPDGSLVYATVATSTESVALIDANPASATYNTVLDTVAVGNNPVTAAVGPDGRLYVTNRYGNSVSVVALTPVP